MKLKWLTLGVLSFFCLFVPCSAYSPAAFSAVVEPEPAASISDTVVSVTGLGDFEAVFTVTLSEPAGLPVKLDYQTLDGSALAGTHYAAQSGSLTIPASQSAGTITVPLRRLDFLTDLTFSVELSAPEHATIADGTATATIRSRRSSFSVGDEVPGGGIGTTFAKVGIPSINSTGDVAFLAEIKSGLVRKQAIFANGQVVASKGDSVPDFEGATFASFTNPAQNDAGSVAFVARLGGRVNASNRAGLYTNFGRELFRVIRIGEPAPGLPDFTLTEFHEFALTDDALFFTCFLCNHHSTPKVHYYSLCVWTPSGGPRLLMREGQQFGARIVARMDTLLPTSGSPGFSRSARGGTITARVRFSGGSTAVVVLDTDGRAEIATQTGNVAPSTGGATLIDYGRPILNSSRGVAVQGFLSGGTTPAALFGDTAAAFDRAYGVGDAVAALPGLTIRSSDAPVYNDRNDIASVVTLTGSGVTRANNKAIIFKAEGSATALVARLGDTPPGLPAGARLKSFTSLALPANRGPVFLAKLATGFGGVTSASDIGLWATDGTGALRLVVRESDTVIVNGAPKTVRTFTALGVVAGSPDQTRACSGNGYVAFLAVFTDGTRSVIRKLVP